MKGPRVESDRDPAPSVSSTLLVGLKAWHADAWQRLIDQYGPRVYGYAPGNSAPSGPYTGSTGMPDMVEKSASRFGDAS